jgi:hypothetical protein
MGLAEKLQQNIIEQSLHKENVSGFSVVAPLYFACCYNTHRNNVVLPCNSLKSCYIWV